MTTVTVDVSANPDDVAMTLNAPPVPPAVYRPLAETVPPVAVYVGVRADVLESEYLPTVENCFVPPVARAAEPGAMETATACGALTLTLTEADLVGSAALVAVTVNEPALLGAVYRPPAEIVPPVADQLTAVLELPLTVAVNCCDPPVVSDAEAGEIATETVAGAATLTAAAADLLVSAMLVAVTT